MHIGNDLALEPDHQEHAHEQETEGDQGLGYLDNPAAALLDVGNAVCDLVVEPV